MESIGVFVPKGGARRLAVQVCSRMPDPDRGLGFQRGVYHDVEPVVLGGTCLYGTVSGLRNFNPKMVTGVIMTCANPTGPQNMTGRTLVNWVMKNYGDKGWVGTWGNLVDQLCMSGIRGQLDAANMLVSPFVQSGKPMVIAVVGLEKMSQCRLGNLFGLDYTAGALDALGSEGTAMGYTAEMTADRFGVSIDDCNALALAENERYRRACAEGWFTKEIVPITVCGKLVDKDALAESLTREQIESAGKFFFRSRENGGILTQFTSSQMSDGAACVVLCNEAALKEYGWEPQARFIGGAIGTVPAQYMGEGLIDAFEKFVEFSYGLFGPDQVKDFLKYYELFELNTAFASIPLALVKKHGLNLEKINVAGGATTPIGHPLGATGVRLVVTMLHLMERFNVRLGYAGACVGEGQGGGCGYEMCQAQA